MNPNIPLGVRSAQVDDPLTMQNKYLTLRDLIDQRRYRAALLRNQESLAQQREQELAQERNLNELFRRPVQPTEQEILSTGGIKALPVIRERRQAEIARLQQEEEERKRQQQQRIEIYNARAALLREKDPAKRAALHKQFTDDFIRRKVLPPESALEPMDDEETMLRDFTRLYGPDKTREMLASQQTAAQQQTKTALDISKSQLEQSIPLLLAAGNQTEWTAALNAVPAEFRQLINPAFSQEAKQRVMQMGITPTAQAQMERQDWTTPGGLVAIATDPARSEADKQRAAAGIQKHEDLRRAGAPTTITPNQQVANEAKARDDYMRDNKNFIAVRDAFSKIQGAARSQTGPGDISLVYGYMRMLDPGSTVREGEFATAQNAGGVPERIRAYWNKLVSGERLDPKIRQQFVDEAGKIYGQSRADYLKTRDMYSGIATRSNMDPRNVVIDLEPATPPAPAAPKGRPSAGATGIPNPIVGPGQQVEVKAPNGKIYYFPNKAAADGFKKRARIP